MIVTLAEVKIFLWIDASDTSQNDLLNLLINSMDAVVKSVIGDIESSQKTVTFELCDIKRCLSEVCLLAPDINITAVNQINWTNYTWVLWTDYFIRKPSNRNICFKTLESYINYDSGYIDITYTSWYASIPEDIVYATLNLISLSYNTDKWQTVKSYKVGDVSVSLWSSEQTDTIIDSVNSILSRYKTFTL